MRRLSPALYLLRINPSIRRIFRRLSIATVYKTKPSLVKISGSCRFSRRECRVDAKINAKRCLCCLIIFVNCHIT